MSTLDVTGNSDRHFVRFAPSLQGRGRLRPWRWDGAAPAKGFVRAAESCCGRFPARRRRGVRSAYFPAAQATQTGVVGRSEEHTSELQSLMRKSYDVFCFIKKNNTTLI